MEGADLMHTQAQHIAERLAARAIADGGTCCWMSP